MIDAANVSSGSVDHPHRRPETWATSSRRRSSATSAQAHVRVFSVGLKSPAFMPSVLRPGLRHGRGLRTASGPAQAAPDLRRAREPPLERVPPHLPLARSLGTPVDVRVTINGVPGYAMTGYRTPALPTNTPQRLRHSQFDRSSARIHDGLRRARIALLIGFAITQRSRPAVRAWSNGSVTSCPSSARQRSPLR